jgi:hypothetical protein
MLGPMFLKPKYKILKPVLLRSETGVQTRTYNQHCIEQVFDELPQSASMDARTESARHIRIPKPLAGSCRLPGRHPATG